MKNWLRVKEAQEYCGVSERTVYNWINNEGLKHSKVNGSILIKVQDIDEFIEMHCVSKSINDEAKKIIRELFN